jgi:hypothetical protein
MAHGWTREPLRDAGTGNNFRSERSTGYSGEGFGVFDGSDGTHAWRRVLDRQTVRSPQQESPSFMTRAAWRAERPRLSGAKAVVGKM